MSLEATLILLDNSSFALNGDYLPTRWQSQVDCASLLIQAKLEANMQSSVGLGLMGGKQVEILCTMTSDSLKANSYLFGCKVHGSLHLTQGLQIGSLVLKYRLNSSQHPRIVCFIGSSITEDAQTLRILGKNLKKNKVAVDFVCFGDCSKQQRQKVSTFIQTVQSEDNSHFLFIEPGDIYLSEKLVGTQIMGQEARQNVGIPNIQENDPELAEAIRMSLQEQEQNNPQTQLQSQPQTQPKQANYEKASVIKTNPDEMTEQELESLAIAMSLQEAKAAEKQEQKKEEKQEEKQEDKQKMLDQTKKEKLPEEKEEKKAEEKEEKKAEEQEEQTPLKTETQKKQK